MADIPFNFKAKLTSGRFILTVIAGVVFAYATYAKILTPEVIATIITAVFISYFQRSDRNGGNGKDVKPPI